MGGRTTARSAREGVMTASVHFTKPQDGAGVSSPVTMSFAVEGMEVRPAGDMTADTGHFSLLLDRGPVPEGEVVPETGRTWHFSNGETSVSLPLPPGRHRLTLQFDNGAHVSYGLHMSKTIIVQVWA
jgi:Domain of unknown function (DUF4399)